MGRIALIVFLILCLPFAAFAQQVAVRAMKDSYSRGEKISVTVDNPLAVSIFTVVAGARPDMGITNIEKKAAVGWDALPLRCRQPSCAAEYVMPEPEEIKPGRAVTFSWQPQIFINNTYVSPEPGTYRVTILYQVKKEPGSRAWNWTTVRSNTFNLE